MKYLHCTGCRFCSQQSCDLQPRTSHVRARCSFSQRVPALQWPRWSKRQILSGIFSLDRCLCFVSALSAAILEAENWSLGVAVLVIMRCALAWWLCECSVVIMQCHCKLTLIYSWECCAVNSTEEVFTVHSGIAIRSMWTNCKWLLTHVIEVTQKSKSRFFFNIYWVFHCYCMIEFLNYKVAPLCCVVSVAVPSKLRSWCCLACAVVGSLDQ